VKIVLSDEAQTGLRRWALEVLDDEFALDELSMERWAWVCVVLRVSPDHPRWFPKGKFATIQHIEAQLLEIATEVLKTLHQL